MNVVSNQSKETNLNLNKVNSTISYLSILYTIKGRRVMYSIEMVIVNCVCISILAYELSTNFSLQKLNTKMYLMVLLVEQVLLIIHMGNILHVYWATYFIYLYFFRNTIKKLMMYISIRYVLFLLQYIVFGGTFYIGYYFVDYSISLMISLIVCLFMSLCLHMKWNSFVDKKQFVYPMRVFMNDQTIQLKGYLDSGNLCVYEGVAIVFVDDKYKHNMNQCNGTLYAFKGVSQYENTLIYLVEISINYHKKQWVYICFNNQINLPYGCECLLNIEM